MRASNSAQSGRALGVLGGIGNRQRRGWRPRPGTHLRALPRVRRHPVVAVAVQARRRAQRGQTLDVCLDRIYVVPSGMTK